MGYCVCDGAADRNTSVLNKKEDYIVYQINNEDGKLTVEEYQVFTGIWLCYKEAHTERFSYPASYPTGLIEITHCRDGRFEYDAGDHFFYLSAGDISVCASKEKKAVVYCPTQYYRGISVIIDPSCAPQCMSCFLEDVKVSPNEILEKFCKKEPYFIMRATERIEHIFSELYSVPHNIRKGYFKVKILELLMFLSYLDPKLSQTEQRCCSRVQVELAKEVCRFINSNMDARLTTEELAAHFFVSPAQLKKCFYNVYGESVYAYLRAYKIRAAAHALQTTDKTVSQIASDYGYSNVSKFSKAFRDIIGYTPTEYRQNKGNGKNESSISEQERSCLE